MVRRGGRHHQLGKPRSWLADQRERRSGGVPSTRESPRFSRPIGHAIGHAVETRHLHLVLKSMDAIPGSHDVRVAPAEGMLRCGQTEYAI
jgi:hypothetical protein